MISSWEQNPLRIDQWFCMLEGWSEEDRAMLLIQSIQLTWKLNLSPTVDQILCSAEAFFYQQMILSWFGHFFKLGREQESTPYWPMILSARRMVRRGQSYAVDSKHSIDLKPQFVAHVSIRYSVLLRPSFINKWFHRGLDISPSWGESGNPLHIDQWFCMLEGWSEEDRAILLIQSVQLTWKLNLLPTSVDPIIDLLLINCIGDIWSWSWSY